MAGPLFIDYGVNGSFCGQKATARVYEDNVLVREALEEEGAGRALVVEGAAATW